jgi:hypothetical protein
MCVCLRPIIIWNESFSGSVRLIATLAKKGGHDFGSKIDGMEGFEERGTLFLFEYRLQKIIFFCLNQWKGFFFDSTWKILAQNQSGCTPYYILHVITYFYILHIKCYYIFFTYYTLHVITYFYILHVIRYIFLHITCY